MKQIVFFILITLITTPVFSQYTQIKSIQEKKVTVSGKVVDTKNESIVGATVIPINGEGGVITDKNGNFSFVVTLNDKIRVSFIGYKKQDILIKNEEDLLITLVYDKIMVGEVVVTGTRSAKRLSDSPILTTVIRDTDIEKGGNTNVFDVLEDNIPGLMIQDAGAMGMDMYIKGLSTQYILILVDGERLASNGRNGNVNLDQIDVSNIQRVEYINDAATALYGSNAMGGVINIITKNAVKKCEANAEYTYETTKKNKARAHISSRQDKYSIYAAGSYADQPYFVSNNGLPFREFDEFSADLKLQYFPIDRLKASITGRFYQIETYNPPTTSAVTHSLENSYTINGQLSYATRDYRHNIVGSVSYNGTDQYNVLELKDNNLLPNDYNSYFSAKVMDSYQINDKFDLISGLEFNQENSSSRDKLGSTPANRANLDGNVFAQADWDITDQFNAVLGARYTYNERFGSAFNPKLSLLYKVKKFSFRGGVGTAYKAPTLRELYYSFKHTGSGSAVFNISGNPNLKAEKGFFSSLSAEFTAKNFNASITTYYNNIRNKINMVEIFDSTNGNTDGFANQTYENVTRAIIKGLDVNARYTAWSQLVFVANYSFCHSIDNETKQQIAGTARHYGTISTTWNAPFDKFPFSLQFAGRLSSPRYNYDDQGNRVSTSGHSIWKAVIVKPIMIKKHRIDLTIKADNIFDTTPEYYTDAGRQFLFGVRYKFN